MSLTQVRLLGILRDREPGIVELAEMLNLDKSSVSGFVDRAQRRGLVERASSKIAQLVEDFSPGQRERFATQAARVVTASGIARGLQAPRAVDHVSPTP